MPKDSVPIGFWKYKSAAALARGDIRAARVALDSNPWRQTEAFRVNELLANLFLMQREYVKAGELFRTILQPEKARTGLKPGEIGTGYLARGMAYEKLGRLARFQSQTETARSYFGSARQNLEQALANVRGRSRWGEAHTQAYLAEVDAGLGRKEQALAEARRAVEEWSMQRDARIAPDMKIIAAIVQMWSGEREAALKQLSEAASLPVWPSAYSICPGLSAGDLELNPLWDELRSDPRFQRLIAEAAKPVEL